MDLNQKYVNLITRARDFCVCLENVRDYTQPEFVAEMTAMLPLIYADFVAIDTAEMPEAAMFETMPQYIDEEYYDSIRRGVESLLGADDTYLETFVDDMKYSDTPIGASLSEGLADIFQDLFNFISVVRESDGAQTAEALVACKENFDYYWSQTLCNVMRPLNKMRLS